MILTAVRKSYSFLSFGNSFITLFMSLLGSIKEFPFPYIHFNKYNNYLVTIVADDFLFLISATIKITKGIITSKGKE